MPKLVKFLLINAAIGFVLALGFVALLMVLDVNGLRTLIWGSDSRYLALFILTFFTGLTFGSVQISVAVMLLGQDDPDKSGMPVLIERALSKLRGWFAPPHLRVMVPVPVKHKKR